MHPKRNQLKQTNKKKNTPKQNPSCFLKIESKDMPEIPAFP